MKKTLPNVSRENDPSQKTANSISVATPDQPSRGTGVVSFSGHETFTLRHGWLKKCVNAVIANSQAFVDDKAMVDLGVGKNMVRSIRHWGLAADVVKESSGTRGADLCVTEFGEMVFGSEGADPFLEDLNTLWLIHWKFATNERRSTVWCWLFNLLRQDEFTRDTIFDLVRSELRRRNLVNPSDSSLKRDVDCAIRTYSGSRTQSELSEDSLECPLVELQLLTSDSDGVLFRFARGPKPSLSSYVFLHCLMDFWQKRSAHDTLAFSEIAFGAGGPGSVFKLDENSIAARLEELQELTKGALIYDETVGLKQVYRRKSIDKYSSLRRLYEESMSVIGD